MDTPRTVLLIDDDRLQFRLTEGFFAHFSGTPFRLEWANNYNEGLATLLRGEYAACLLDYQLGERDGLELIREAITAGCHVPIIFLTAETGENIDIEAMNAGALDYLVKGEINPRTLERSLRYALKLAETMEALRQLATHDELTGLLNRREFERVLKEEEERSRRFMRPLSVLFLDVDYFKKVNDTYGHAAGDEVLREVARRVLEQIRSVDRLARIGGEEFAVMLAEANGVAALDVARRIVAAMESIPVRLSDGTRIGVTLSAGAAEMEGPAVRAEELLARADRALYAAKARGRNRALSAAELG